MRPPVVRLLGSHALAAVAMSLPWPWLLVLVWDRTHSPGLLGLTAAVADAALRRVLLVGGPARRPPPARPGGPGHRWSVAWCCSAAVPVAVGLDQVAAAVVLAALAVAVATPAYPALAAAMPEAAGEDAARATDLLVTIEVASFVVGPAFGGLLLGVPGSGGSARRWPAPAPLGP